MKYLNSSFTVATCTKPMSKLEYDLAVGKISQYQYDLAIAAQETADAADANLKNMFFSS